MKDLSAIAFVLRHDIDEVKWEKCILSATNSRVYVNFWHLDRIAVNWIALVYGDYEFVMPLPVKQKLTIEYVYQPLFCQQLGIFPKPSAEIASIFYQAVFERFRFADVHINSQNPILTGHSAIRFFPRNNFLLDLQYNYKSLARSYSTNTKRNIAKATDNNLQLIAGISTEDYLQFKSRNLTGKLKREDLEKLKGIISNARYRGIGEIFGVYSAENEICAAVFFYRWKNRVIYMNAATSEIGKKLGAMYFLVDKFIRDNAETDLIIDFEGSMIPGVARFYSGFGATPETYYQLKFNRLPAIVKWLKPL